MPERPGLLSLTMEIEISNGGPAFPAVIRGVDENGAKYIIESAGMSLRDWFAGQALALMADGTYNGTPENTAETCYRVADAMIAKRSKQR